MDCVVGVVAAVKRGGGKLARVSFPAKNGDRCGDSAIITIQGNSLESPCKAPFLARKSFREQLQVKFSFSQNAVFSAKILESHIALESKNLDSSSSLSLRDTAPAVARQSTSAKNAKVDSRNDYSANAEFMDCHDFASAKSRNDGNRVFYPNAASKKVDSSNDYSASAKLMDCHASTAALARNDRKNATILKTPAKDSRIFDKTAQNVFSQNATRRQDFGDKNGALQGDSRAHTRAYVSAESPQQSPFLAQKPTPKRLAL